ncbi:MAG: hypothetical protein PHH77_00770 [Victivallaceae bacterium]|nr:hypothetical protein [Victivallaceae bacterium]
MNRLSVKSVKRENGIALLFSLIILSLLLILTLAFTLDSMFNQKAAYNSSSSSSAGLLAQAQLKKVLTLIQYYDINFDSDSRFYSYAGTSTDPYMTDMLKDRLNTPFILDNTTDPCLTPTPPKVQWNYIRSGPNATDPIIGRTAFVVIPGLIPLNSLISKTVDESGSAATLPEVYNERRVGKEVSEINIRNCMYQMNAGDDPATYTITPAMADIFNWLKTEDDVTSNRDAGKFTGIWPDYLYIFSEEILNLGSPIPDAGDLAKFKENFEKTFVLGAPEDKEVFWADLDNDGSLDSGELYSRFNLVRNDWYTDLAGTAPTNINDLNFIYTQILLDSAHTGTPAQTMQQWETTDNAETSVVGLPWLACFGYQADGNQYPSGTALTEIMGSFKYAAAVDDYVAVFHRRCQIAANLKDYCDSDSRPTSDVDPTTWKDHDSTSTAPIFTGNEKTPYINKVGIQIDAGFTRDEDKNTATLAIKPLVGLINIYGAAWSVDLRVRIIGSVTVACEIAGNPIVLDTDPGAAGADSVIPFDTTILVTSSTNWPGGGYSHFLEGTITNGTTTAVDAEDDDTVEINITAVNIDKVILYDATTTTYGYDYVKNLTLSDITTASPFTAFSASSTPGTANSWYGFEVNDPRQDLNPGDWVQYPPSTTQSTPAGKVQDVFSLNSSDATICESNAANSFRTPATSSPARVAPSAGDDAETNDDPANCHLSTAYIRNARMESPWELGFIHRGKAWQTINLKVYDTGKAYQTATMAGSTNRYIAGGGTYAAGDANIIDQIKMTASPTSSQKINLNAPSLTVFKALLSQLRYGGAIDSSMSIASLAGYGTTAAGTELTSPQITTIAGSIADKYELSTSSLEQCLTRASVVDLLLLSGSSTPALGTVTDAAQEELIGKVVNLTKIDRRASNFTIIILAQAIKDIGGSGSDIQVTKTSANGSTDQVQCQLGHFDITPGTDSDPDEWRDDVYGDEVTGEQKILVRGYRDIYGKVTITNYQYLD